jgi:RND family efflux transporter MFP subunit
MTAGREIRLTLRPVAVALALGLALAATGAQAQTLDCLIHPYVLVGVSAATEGVIDRVHVDRGDLVREGQVLATLESTVERATVTLATVRTEIESALKSSQVRLDFGIRRWQRTEEMFKKDLVPLKEKDEAETAKILAEHGLLEAQENRKLALTELERTRAQLALRTVRSPITGVVTERLLHPGEYAKSVPILKLAQIDPLRVEVIVPVALYGQIHVGSRAEVVPEAPLSGTYRARVTVVDRVVDAASGTFGVRLELPNPDYRLPAGLKCRVRFSR